MSAGKYSNNLKKHRILNNLSQKELGGIVGISDKGISKWERGERKINPDCYAILSEVLGITTDELLGLESKNKIESSIGTSISRKIEILDFKKVFHIEYFLVKMFIVLSLVILSLFNQVNQRLSIFVFVVIGVILADLYFLFRKKNKKSCLIPYDDVTLQKTTNNPSKHYKLTKRLYSTVAFYVIVFVGIMLMYTGLYVNQLMTNAEVIVGVVVMFLIGFLLYMIIIDVIKWKNKNIIEIDTYLYHKGLLPLKVILVFTDLSFMVFYSFVITGELSSSNVIYWIILILSPMIVAISHLQYLDRLNFLREYSFFNN